MSQISHFLNSLLCIGRHPNQKLGNIFIAVVIPRHLLHPEISLPGQIGKLTICDTMKSEGVPATNLLGQVLGAGVCTVFLGLVLRYGASYLLKKFDRLRLPKSSEITGFNNLVATDH